jgi:hypothetical protein
MVFASGSALDWECSLLATTAAKEQHLVGNVRELCDRIIRSEAFAAAAAGTVGARVRGHGSEIVVDALVSAIVRRLEGDRNESEGHKTPPSSELMSPAPLLWCIPRFAVCNMCCCRTMVLTLKGERFLWNEEGMEAIARDYRRDSILAGGHTEAESQASSVELGRIVAHGAHAHDVYGDADTQESRSAAHAHAAAVTAPDPVRAQLQRMRSCRRAHPLLTRVCIFKQLQPHGDRENGTFEFISPATGYGHGSTSTSEFPPPRA